MEIKSDISNLTNLCPECGGNIISLQEKGEIVCGQCGLVIRERILDIIIVVKGPLLNKRRKKEKEQDLPFQFYCLTWD